MRDDANTPDKNTPSQGGLLEFKAEDFSHHMDEFDLSEEQQAELLQTLWNIMSAFVDIGWGVDTVQLFLPEIFNAENADKLAHDSGKLLDSSITSDVNRSDCKKGGYDHG